ncbi:hypothetical protein HDU79_002651 [Rhizoclosmatium sp. JEL0117]|nr:hypothetical protein HDU79_002651 [Rhizoclosmatium sp. JEL0117]
MGFQNTIIDYDYVLVLNDGNVVEFGAPAELLKKGEDQEDAYFTRLVSETGDEGRQLLVAQAEAAYQAKKAFAKYIISCSYFIFGISPKTMSVDSIARFAPTSNDDLDDQFESAHELAGPSESHTSIQTVEVEVLDDEPRSILLSLVSQLTVGMDLHKVTLPTFVLETRSMCEKITDFFSHPDLITEIPTLNDPVDRFIAVTRFFLSGWHIRPKGVKKPYNPVLGEFFRCSWTLSDGSTSFYVCEQVSHHPPISTYTYINPHHRIHIDGDLRPKSRFLGNSAATLMHGSTRIRITPQGATPSESELYVITFPNVYARGILFGTMYTELGDVATIACAETDLYTAIDFKTRGVFSDRSLNVVDGPIKQKSSNTIVAQISGKWSDELFVEKFVEQPSSSLQRHSRQNSVDSSDTLSRPSILQDVPPRSLTPTRPSKSVANTLHGLLHKASSAMLSIPSPMSSTTSSPINTISRKKSLFNAATAIICPKTVPPESEMESFESQRLWKRVTKGILNKDLDEATAEKTAIEENQRRICKLREDKGEAWHPRFFVANGDVWTLDIEELSVFKYFNG